MVVCNRAVFTGKSFPRELNTLDAPTSSQTVSDNPTTSRFEFVLSVVKPRTVVPNEIGHLAILAQCHLFHKYFHFSALA